MAKRQQKKRTPTKKTIAAMKELDSAAETTIVLGPEEWKAFLETLASPPNPNKRLVKLMQKHVVWR